MRATIARPELAASSLKPKIYEWKYEISAVNSGSDCLSCETREAEWCGAKEGLRGRRLRSGLAIELVICRWNGVSAASLAILTPFEVS